MAREGAIAGRIEGTIDLFLVSALSLFLEILLIRWVSTEIRIFAYFSNLVLVVCFLGLGLGYAAPRLKLGLHHAAWLVALLVLLTHPLLAPLGFHRISEALAWTDINTWAVPMAEKAQWVLGFGRLAVMLVILALIFVPFGRLLGDYFNRTARRLPAYSWNIAGSIAGVWLFAALSFANLAPVMWLAVAAALFLVPLRRYRRILAVAAVGLGLALALLATAVPKDGTTVWSAYQKLVLRTMPENPSAAYSLEVNNTLYQYVLDLSDKALDRSPVPLPVSERGFYYYNLPYRLHAPPDNVLVVGAGTGNDVAAALRNGARHIDAVEIDAAIVTIGRRFHPEHPYDDPRVHLIVNDARAFFKKTDKRYDVIVFGLLDSHRLTSNYSNINLDSYVYTLESFREARRLLRPGGLLVVAFQTFYPYIAWRLHDTLEQATGGPPLVLYVAPQQSLLEGTGGVIFIAGDLAAIRRSDPHLDRTLKTYEEALPEPFRRAATTEPVRTSTDDWPYLYVQSARIPSLWLAIIGLVVVLALAAAPAAGLTLRKLSGQFVFLGAAFLFLETYTITRAQLYFGTTWLVSSIVITAILCVILIGNAIVVRWRPTRVAPWYAALLVAALVNWWASPESLVSLGPVLASTLMAALASIPILFAGVIFGSAFIEAPDARIALSSNLLGALVGGLIGCVSFVTGLRTIALFAVAFYAAAWLFHSLEKRAAARAPTPT